MTDAEDLIYLTNNVHYSCNRNYRCLSDNYFERMVNVYLHQACTQ